MFYLDSSILVCLFSNEARTRDVQTWREERKNEVVWVSDWNITEFHSAMSFKRRTAQMSVEQRRDAEVLFKACLKLYPDVLNISSAHFRRAATIAGREDINIRAADALHLAIVEASGATICTLDNKMHHAAGVLEIACLAP
ncbi:MAG: VapC toxin family domain ribonuclease [Rhizobium sp.]|nr:VapC toxin family domain ribonuclease [Rhizobium sp.]